ncbi:MAG: hypothetical protein RMK99_05100 [Anaerolineales bacterium]|nr:hypothetical protein [Anaerolineales bacterium]
MSPPAEHHGRQRDFWLGVLNGVLFTLAETLTDPTLVLVAFVSRLTQSPSLIGLVAPLRDAGWFLPQLWLSGYVQSVPYKLVLYRRAAIVRLLAWGGLAAAPFILNSSLHLLLAFYLTFSVYALASGFAGLTFVEVVGKTIPPPRRLVFFAWRLFLGGVAALGGAAVVRWLLDERGPLPFPYNFGVLFAAGWAFAAVGLVAFGLIREPPDVHLRPRAAFIQQLLRALHILRTDHLYRHFLLMRASLLLAGAAVPFFAVFVETRLGGALNMVGVYLATYIAASLVANIAFGRFAERLGNRGVVLLAALAGLLMLLLVGGLVLVAAIWGVSGEGASRVLALAFALLGIRDSGLGISSQPLLLALAPADDRSLYLGFTHTLLGLVLLSTGLSGLVVQVFGFPVLLILTLLMNLLGFVLALNSQFPE